VKYLAKAKKEIQRMIDEHDNGFDNIVTSGYSSDSGIEGFETEVDDENANTYGASGLSAYMSDTDTRAVQAPTVRVTPAFLAPNKSPNKSRVFSKTVQLSSFAPFKTLVAVTPLSPSARVPRIPPAPSAFKLAPTRATPASRSATVPGIPRTSRSRRPVRLAITVFLKITPTLGNRKTPQNLSP
jgi:hypothetical protein